MKACDVGKEALVETVAVAVAVAVVVVVVVRLREHKMKRCEKRVHEMKGG